jgi:hypothetical protein
MKSASHSGVPGFSIGESARAICRAMDYVVGRQPLDKSVDAVRTSYWPNLSKQVEGGLQHVISVDNAAGYAELWSRGGNWYAVTGATMPGDASLKKSAKWAVYEIPRLRKGLGIEEATAIFLSRLFGDEPLKKSGGCNCGGRR